MSRVIGRYRIVNNNKKTKGHWKYIEEYNKKTIEDSIKEYAFEHELEIEYEIYSLYDYGTASYE